MLNKICLLAAVIAAIAFVSASVSGQTWDYANDFSTSANPAGAWSYGRLDSSFGSFALDTTAVNDGVLWIWIDPPTLNPSPGKSIGGPTDLGTCYFPADAGFLISPANDYKPDIRWTAPVAARVQVSATFTGLQVAGSNSDVMILHNLNTTTKVFSALLEGYGAGGPYPTMGANPVATFTGEMTVYTGDTIDFLASKPASRTEYDRIGFAASIMVLELIELPSLTGTVTDAATGAKLAGAKVKVVGTPYEAVTDDLGAYSIPLAPGNYSLEVSLTWYEPKTVTDVVQTLGGTAQDVALDPVVVTGTSWDFAADFDPDNNPTPSANVPIWSYVRWSDDLTTMDLSDYAFDFSGGRFWWVDDYNYAYCMKAYSNVDIDGAYVPAGAACLSPGQSPPTKGSARWTSPIAGKVWVHAVFTGQGYSPMTNADVHVVRNCGTPQAEELFLDIITGFIGGGGHPAVGEHPRTGWWGAIDVNVHDTIDFMAGDAGDGRLMDITRLDGGIEVCSGTGTVSGTVINGTDNQAIEGALVQVVGRTEYAITDYFGQYSIALPAGSFTIKASKDSVGTDEKPLTLADGDSKVLDFALGIGIVQGTVTEAESPNRPLMGAVVKVIGGAQSAVTNENGHYSMSLGAGQYDLSASAAGRAAVTQPVTVPSGGSTKVDFALARTTSWNYTADFSSVDNPAGEWSYGWLDGTLSVLTLSDMLVGEGALRFWAYPAVLNPSPGRSIGGPTDAATVSAYFPADEGFLISPANEAKADAVWTAPFAGRVSISAVFKGLQYVAPGSNSQVMIIKNQESATPIFSGVVQGYYGGGGHDPIGTNHTATYTGEVTVAAGDQIHFAAGDTVPSRGGYDRLGFDATITLLEAYQTVAVSGVVTDSGTGSPIADLPVTLTPSGQTSSGLSCLTSATGSYLIYAPAGSYTIAAGLPGVYLSQSASLQVTGSSVSRNFSLAKVTSWNVADEWSWVSNPTPSATWPIWTYGRYDYYGAAFFPYLTTYMGYGGGGYWYDNGLFSSAIAAIPGEIDADGTYMPAGTIAFAPAAVGGADGSGVRWTAPYAATVRVNSVWSGRSYSTVTYGEVYVHKNATRETVEQLNYDILNGFAGGNGHLPVGPYPVSVWSGLVPVEKGDTIDFHVGFALGGPRTVTGLVATIAVAGSDAVTATDISSLKTLPDGQFVKITEPKVVTVATDTFTDGTCYMEDENRVSGIRIVLGPGLVINLGQRITVEGIVGTDANGERTLFVSAITSQVEGLPIGPLGAPNKSIKATVTGASLSGLLVTGWGQVKAKSETGQVIYLDDGSGVVGEPGTTGIKVVLNDTTTPTLLEVGNTVAVTGVCAQNRTAGVAFPVILARDQEDVKIN